MRKLELIHQLLDEHLRATRRQFVRWGSLGAAAVAALPLRAQDISQETLQRAVEQLPHWLTEPGNFQDVSRGNPKPHRLPPEKLAEVGLTRETWRLQVISDPQHPANLNNPLSTDNGTALDFAGLMKLAEKNSVRIPKVMTCLNIGCPLGMGIWEGVPLRDIVWMAKPTENLRRMFYYGYHNDDPAQIFRSSLPIGRVLEDPLGLPPVILCTKLNGQWLTPERGGPVRVLVPEAYGFKSVKWLTHVVLSNISHANDTYAEKNNDVDSDLKTFCATLTFPAKAKPGEPLPVTGWAQAGISGLKKVQVWIHKQGQTLPDDDPYFTTADWQDAEILGPSKLPRELTTSTFGFSSTTGLPLQWPLRLTHAHWAYLHPGLEAGTYTMRCRTIDEQGAAQPMPRPFRKSGHAAIEQQRIVIEAA